jgi:hypothetical protein
LLKPRWKPFEEWSIHFTALHLISFLNIILALCFEFFVFYSFVNMSSEEIEKALDVETSDNGIADPEKISPTKEESSHEVEDEAEKIEYLSGLRLVLIIMVLCLAVLLMGLVRRPQ